MEKYTTLVYNGIEYIGYTFVTNSGDVFYTNARSLEVCRKRCTAWLKSNRKNNG